ncbi:hypothetical protein AWJ20_1547 [Sugiyamaella lignohabitans]|uniref:Uncharacterized protein n=1 Tax=Sugiyamaella lignohabitans TaxID=796027 RepID=A0A161HX34_9ASCO|nr:uncharacterized protein AWJ20_1547 [Sugiyamaella lignohabitans]ANB13263.1 hypothetical protein AWJ20_1547 [Sugiyamaella lignohabitans]
MSTITARGLYRKLYRELARQHLTAAEAQTAQDAKKKEALLQYRKLQGLDSGDGAKSSVAPENRIYKADTLRNVFNSSDPTEANLLFGYEIGEYLKSQRAYKSLLERYNPGANMEDEERIRLSARRVGLNLPEESS